MIDLLLINPGGRSRIYQGLGEEFTAIEPPLWCRLIAGYCRDRGWSVHIIDADALDLSADDVKSHIIACDLKSRLIAIVAYGHQPSASTQQMASAHDIAVAIKGIAPTIMLGGHVAALPKRTLEEEPVDFVCNSEGPETVAGLLRNMASWEVPGLVWRDSVGPWENPPPPLIKDLDTDLHGEAWDLLPMWQYRAHNWQCFDGSPRTPYASIYTSLGCPYKCVFCCINAPFGTNRYRMRSPAKVVAEIDHLYQVYGVKTFKIIDEMFVLNHNHVRAVCTLLARLPYAKDLNIWAYARVDTVKDDQPAMLRAAGIRWLALGIEAASSTVRDGAAKSFDDLEIFRTVRKIQAAGINVIGNFIFGLPNDTLESMRDTLNLAKRLNCEFANFYSAMAYPGSKLFSEADQSNLPETWAGYSQHSIDTTPLPTATLTSKEVLFFRDYAFADYFLGDSYLNMVYDKFGGDVKVGVMKMAQSAIQRVA